MEYSQYRKPFYLTRANGGNGLLIPDGFPEVRLRVAPVVAGNLDDVRLSNEIAFLSEDDGVVRSGNGLENFIETTIAGTPTVVFDNHNHAMFFWYQARERGYIEKGATLVHIDMHSDLWHNEFSLATDALDLEEAWKFTNFSCNVGNYIKPTMEEGLVGEMIRIEWEQDLLREESRVIPRNSILNLDLDFFADELDDIDFEFKKRVVLHFAKQVSYITIATSPFFIPGERAISVMKRVFEE